MEQKLADLHRIALTTKKASYEFMAMLEPVINQTKSDYGRLFYRHIFEEEEEHVKCLTKLLGLLEDISSSPSNKTLSLLLQALSIEEFVQKRFLHHLDFAIHYFQDEVRQPVVTSMRASIQNDYTELQKILLNFNNQYVKSEEEKTTPQKVTINKRGFSVGSLFNK
ncbi:IMEF encapsulin system ferritin-like cargo protein [Bacillus solitudinis]|uniref:IMEF encapsulin system ferritin-like cargo protein n=1 Tax=Bacillus solitudinis TaxID=2014074 RepID=UPI0012FD7EE1|nr:IMEF encapsulin system ferritin-like cargo protein [Bacillus solitudinis]